MLLRTRLSLQALAVAKSPLPSKPLNERNGPFRQNSRSRHYGCYGDISPVTLLAVADRLRKHQNLLGGSIYNRNAKEAHRHMLEHITDSQAVMGSAT